MDPKRKRELRLAAVAVLLLAIAAWTLMRGTPQPPAAGDAAATTAARASQAPKSPLTEVDLKALEAERPEPGESTRNPFRFKTKPVPPPPQPTAAQIKQ